MSLPGWLRPALPPALASALAVGLLTTLLLTAPAATAAAFPSVVPSGLMSPSTSEASPPPAAASAEVLEVLRLQVPAAQRQAWLAAEQASWEPWLARQDGFLGRDLFWDPQRQEAHLLIRWASRAQWKAIRPEAVAQVQAQFESLARELTGSTLANPFPLVFEGELLPL